MLRRRLSWDSFSLIASSNACNWRINKKTLNPLIHEFMEVGNFIASYFSVSEFKFDHVIEMLEWILIGAIILFIRNNHNSSSFLVYCNYLTNFWLNSGRFVLTGLQKIRQLVSLETYSVMRHFSYSGRISWLSLLNCWLSSFLMDARVFNCSL